MTTNDHHKFNLIRIRRKQQIPLSLFFRFQNLLLMMALVLSLHPVQSSELAAAASRRIPSSCFSKAGESSSSTSSSSNSRVVSYLPGLNLPGGDPLPFHLETGYVGVGESMDIQLFYYFIKSERNPKEDPVLLWLTGGPRCSAFSALAFEIGPIYFNKVEYNGTLPTLVLNSNSWTKIANIIFLDSPVDTGFSYSKSSKGLMIGDKQSAAHNYEFLRKWLIEEHPEFQSNPLYIGGDSYSGIIIPIIVQDLINDIEAGKHPFLNFKGYLIGNGVSDKSLESNSKIPFAHGMGLISNELYESMKENCKGNFLNFDLTNVNCSKDRELFDQCISGLFTPHVLEPTCARDSPDTRKAMEYRRSLTGIKEVSTSMPPPFLGCRNYDYMLAYYWANDDHVRDALHIRKGTVGNWIRCKTDLLPYDVEVESNIDYHRNLSTKGYRSLIYSGDHDMLVTHVSTEAWIRSLDLPIADDWRPWHVRGQVAGYTRSYSNGMTYATVKGGGHTAPEYKPEECLAMFERYYEDNNKKIEKIDNFESK